MEPKNYKLMTWQERKSCREQYIEHQQGLCYHCKTPLLEAPAKSVQELRVRRELFPKTFFDNPIHLHHNHTTDLTYGAVHAFCNAVLWQYHGE